MPNVSGKLTAKEQKTYLNASALVIANHFRNHKFLGMISNISEYNENIFEIKNEII